MIAERMASPAPQANRAVTPIVGAWAEDVACRLAFRAAPPCRAAPVPAKTASAPAKGKGRYIRSPALVISPYPPECLEGNSSEKFAPTLEFVAS